MFIEAEMVVGDHIKFDNNTICSDWVDVVDLVRAQDVLVVDSNDDDVGTEFLAAIASHRKDLVKTTGKADNTGICLRWILGTMGADTRIKLIAQVKIINKIIVKCAFNRTKTYSRRCHARWVPSTAVRDSRQTT